MHPGLSNAEYHGGPEVSKSSTDIIRKSPAHYKHSRTAERHETSDQRIGTLFHALTLEPEIFWDCYAEPFVAPEGALSTMDDMKAHLKSLDLPTTGKRKEDLAARIRENDPSAVILDDARAEHTANVGDKEIITAGELATAEAMRDAVMAHPIAGKLLAPGSGVAELSFYWTDPTTGIRCRCRPDFLRFDKIAVDLKSARDASPEGFSKSINTWRYHVQDPFYCDGIAHALEQGDEAPIDIPAPDHFIFVAVEKVEPFAVGVYALDAQSVDIGRREYHEDLATFAECIQSDHWPSYGDKIQRMSLPGWRLRQDDYENAQ